MSTREKNGAETDRAVVNFNERSEDPTEVELLTKARAGNQAAFNSLLAAHRAKMYIWVSQMIRTLNVEHSEIPDIVQEASIKAWLNIDKFRGDSKFTTWLYTITRNQAINQSNQNRRFATTNNISAMETENESIAEDGLINRLAIDTETPEETLAAKELHTKVMMIIDELPPKLRNTIILRELGQLSYEEISQRTGTKLGTVKTQIHRARSAIDKALEQWRKE